MRKLSTPIASHHLESTDCDNFNKRLHLISRFIKFGKSLNTQIKYELNQRFNIKYIFLHVQGHLHAQTHDHKHRKYRTQTHTAHTTIHCICFKSFPDIFFATTGGVESTTIQLPRGERRGKTKYSFFSMSRVMFH